MKNTEEDNKRKKFYIPVDGKYYETTEEIYKVYYRMDRRERYLEERDMKKGLLNFSALDNDKYKAEEMIPDQSIDIEDEIANKVMIEAVLDAITTLEEEEKWLIQELFFYGKSEVVVAKENGIARTTLQSRKYKLLEKIKRQLKF